MDTELVVQNVNISLSEGYIDLEVNESYEFCAGTYLSACQARKIARHLNLLARIIEDRYG